MTINERAIAYVGLAYTTKDGTKTLKIDGVAPRPEAQHTYPLSRTLFYYTVGDPDGPAAAFLEWAVTDPKAREVVERVGFIPWQEKPAGK